MFIDREHIGGDDFVVKKTDSGVVIAKRAPHRPRKRAFEGNQTRRISKTTEAIAKGAYLVRRLPSGVYAAGADSAVMSDPNTAKTSSLDTLGARVVNALKGVVGMAKPELTVIGGEPRLAKPGRLATYATLASLLTASCAPLVASQSKPIDYFSDRHITSVPEPVAMTPHGTLPTRALLATSDDNQSYSHLGAFLGYVWDNETVKVLETSNEDALTVNGVTYGIRFVSRFSDDDIFAAEILLSDLSDGQYDIDGTSSGSYERGGHRYAVSYQGRARGCFYGLGIASTGDKRRIQDDPIGGLTFLPREDRRLGVETLLELGYERENIGTNGNDVRVSGVWRRDQDTERADYVDTLGIKVLGQIPEHEFFGTFLREKTDESERHPGIDPHERLLVGFGGVHEIGSSSNRKGTLNWDLVLDLSDVRRIARVGFSGLAYAGNNDNLVIGGGIYRNAQKIDGTAEVIERGRTGIEFTLMYSF